MSDAINAEIWYNNFMNEIERNEPELAPLYANQITFSENEEGKLFVSLWDAVEPHASKEQISRMRELFNDFKRRHPF